MLQAGTTRRGVLDCRLRIQPSPASQTYTVRLIYRHGRPPKVTVTDPPLALHPDASQLPHVYPGNELCLYYPGEWKHDMLLSATILPWTAEWLIHYELWLATGTWAGGGYTHTAGRCCEPSGQIGSLRRIAASDRCVASFEHEAAIWAINGPLCMAKAGHASSILVTRSTAKRLVSATLARAVNSAATRYLNFKLVMLSHVLSRLGRPCHMHF